MEGILVTVLTTLSIVSAAYGFKLTERKIKKGYLLISASLICLLVIGIIFQNSFFEKIIYDNHTKNPIGVSENKEFLNGIRTAIKQKQKYESLLWRYCNY